LAVQKKLSRNRVLCACEAIILRARELFTVAYYERNLPHWHPSGAAIFLTWRLYGSLPTPFSPQAPESTARETFTQPFRRIDAALDRALRGPVWMKEEAIAACVTAIIERGAAELHQYRLHAFVVMANHVHLLINPLRPIGRLTNSLKGSSARECNRLLQRTGAHFWQDESFDHWVRTTIEFERILAYIEQNPVAAQLVKAPEHWPWSSASRKSALITSKPS